MNSSNKANADCGVGKSSSVNKVAALNPNAAEFVPSSLKYSYEATKISDVAEFDLPGSSGNVVFDRSVSNISNNSDDEVHRYWRQQLPDDITPDFVPMGGDELHDTGHLTLAGLSINNSVEQSNFPGRLTSQIVDMRKDLSSLSKDNDSLTGNIGYTVSLYATEQSSVASMSSPASLWGKPFESGEKQEGYHFNDDYNACSTDENAFLENSVTDPIEFLSSQFPGFATQSLADVYYGNQCDLNLTVEILTQLEVQVDNGFDQNLATKSLVAPNFSPLGFPALPVTDSENGLSKYIGGSQCGSVSYRSNFSRGEIDFASTIRKLSSQDSGQWKYDRNGSADGSTGSSRSSSLSGNSYNNVGSKSICGDKWISSDVVRASPVWLETSEAVANIYSEAREEARDLARLRNACFEQARPAYLIGNKALAKELGFKGQLHNMHMKAAHENAKDAIYRKRNPVASMYGREQDRLIDLHALHVSEALQVLNHELRALRNTARVTRQRLHVMICVGTGHHTKGSRTPARLPVAVEQYLLEEGVRFTQLQPGMISAVIH